MRVFLARFELPNGGRSFSEIWAKTKDEANEIAAARGMHPVTRAEGPRKEFRPSRLAQQPGGWARYDVLHSLCYLSFLAGRHGVTDVTGVVGDDSPLHELAHYLQMGPNVRGGQMLQHLEARVAWLESIIPGMPPADLHLPLPELTEAEQVQARQSLQEGLREAEAVARERGYSLDPRIAQALDCAD